ncbi:MAG: dihydroneopterin aldolase [Bacteroidales bacterium]|nr:dihydroneopterin aldolase [Bacteroidales bacterium]
MTGLIELQDMEFYAYHGCYDAEKKVGGRFLVNLWLEYDIEKAAQTDNIKDALNYQVAYEIVEEQMKIKSSLLENVCQRILDALFAKFPELLTAQVDVSKMAPAIKGKMKAVTMTLRSEKEDRFGIQHEEEDMEKPDSGFHTSLFNIPSC